MEKDTVSGYFVRAALMAFEGQPDAAKARARVLAAAAIAPSVLAAPAARVTAEAFAALWLAIARELDDEFFGLDSRRMKVGSFDLLCRALVQCADLRSALRLMIEMFRLIFDDVVVRLSDEGQLVRLIVECRVPDPARAIFAQETQLVMLHGVMCWLAGRRIPLASASFAYSSPPQASEYRVMFSGDLRFDAPVTAVEFAARYLQAPVVQTSESVREFLRAAPQSIFLKYRNDRGWVARVRRRLRGVQGPSWPTLDILAGDFGLAPATLRRRLEAEGSSFREVKDGLRRDRAIDALCQTERTVAEIAVTLGFSEPSAFHRAFKQWTGVRPGQYRASPLHPSIDVSSMVSRHHKSR